MDKTIIEFKNLLREVINEDYEFTPEELSNEENEEFFNNLASNLAQAVFRNHGLATDATIAYYEHLKNTGVLK